MKKYTNNNIKEKALQILGAKLNADYNLQVNYDDEIYTIYVTLKDEVIVSIHVSDFLVTINAYLGFIYHSYKNKVLNILNKYQNELFIEKVMLSDFGILLSITTPIETEDQLALIFSYMLDNPSLEAIKEMANELKPYIEEATKTLELL